jgi:hypothetical protein
VEHEQLSSAAAAMARCRRRTEELKMAISVKNIVLWRKEVDNRPGALADTLAPLAGAGASLQVVMGYRFPGHESRAAIELYPVAGQKATNAARSAGLAAASIPALLVEGDDRPGLGHAVAKAMAEAGIDLDFLVAQVLGKRYRAVIGFATSDDATKAAGLIRKASTAKKATAKKKLASARKKK